MRTRRKSIGFRTGPRKIFPPNGSLEATLLSIRQEMHRGNAVIVEAELINREAVAGEFYSPRLPFTGKVVRPPNRDLAVEQNQIAVTHECVTTVRNIRTLRIIRISTSKP